MLAGFEEFIAVERHEPIRKWFGFGSQIGTSVYEIQVNPASVKLIQEFGQQSRVLLAGSGTSPADGLYCKQTLTDLVATMQKARQEIVCMAHGTEKPTVYVNKSHVQAIRSTIAAWEITFTDQTGYTIKRPAATPS